MAGEREKKGKRDKGKDKREKGKGKREKRRIGRRNGIIAFIGILGRDQFS